MGRATIFSLRTVGVFARYFNATRFVRRPKSPNWIIRGTLRGIRIEESTGVADRRAAEELRAKREAEVLPPHASALRIRALLWPITAGVHQPASREPAG